MEKLLLSLLSVRFRLSLSETSGIKPTCLYGNFYTTHVYHTARSCLPCRPSQVHHDQVIPASTMIFQAGKVVRMHSIRIHESYLSAANYVSRSWCLAAIVVYFIEVKTYISWFLSSNLILLIYSLKSPHPIFHCMRSLWPQINWNIGFLNLETVIVGWTLNYRVSAIYDYNTFWIPFALRTWTEITEENNDLNSNANKNIQ